MVNSGEWWTGISNHHVRIFTVQWFELGSSRIESKVLVRSTASWWWGGGTSQRGALEGFSWLYRCGKKWKKHMSILFNIGFYFWSSHQKATVKGMCHSEPICFAVLVLHLEDWWNHANLNSSKTEEMSAFFNAHVLWGDHDIHWISIGYPRNFHVYTMIYPWYFHRLKHHWQERPRDAKYGRWTKKISREKAAAHQSRDENHSERRPDEIWWIWNKWSQQIGWGRESSQSSIEKQWFFSSLAQVIYSSVGLKSRVRTRGHLGAKAEHRGMAWGCPKIWETEVCTAHGIFLVHMESYGTYHRIRCISDVSPLHSPVIIWTPCDFCLIWLLSWFWTRFLSSRRSCPKSFDLW